ncbi:MAG: PcfB family protein [Lachnospiraceae bacterium]|nr:PcfB family protein [Lachnospiraceae bacterium]
MQEEVENKTVNIAVKTGKLTASVLYRALRAYLQNAAKEIDDIDAVKVKKGRQSVKELIGQGEAVKSADIDDIGLKDFKKTVNKYGVDFAIVKDKKADPSKYVVFFKAKDSDVIHGLMQEYTKKTMNMDGEAKETKEVKPSILQKLKNFIKEVASTPHKEKKKEQTR